MPLMLNLDGLQSAPPHTMNAARLEPNCGEADADSGWNSFRCCVIRLPSLLHPLVSSIVVASCLLHISRGVRCANRASLVDLAASPTTWHIMLWAVPDDHSSPKHCHPRISCPVPRGTLVFATASHARSLTSCFYCSLSYSSVEATRVAHAIQ